MKKSNTLNKDYFLFVAYISILIVLISSLVIISLAIPISTSVLNDYHDNYNKT
jgi:hypothetical protein